MNKQELLKAVAAEVERLPKDWSVDVSYDVHMLMSVIAALQLAMRHPKLKTTPTFHVIKHVVSHLMAGIPEDMPALREMARLGDNPKYDD